MNVAIFGAAGAIGRQALPLLLERGHSVRLVGRDAARLSALADGRAEVCAADLADPRAARRAAEGIDAVVFSVGLPYHQSDGYLPLTQNAVDAARAAGVRTFILISTVYLYGRARTATVAETHVQEPHTVKGRNRLRQAEIVRGAHADDGLRTLVLVLPDFYGPTADLSYPKQIFDAALTGKPASVIGPLDVPREYVYLPDVVRVLGDLLERDDAFGRTYHLGGAGTITTRQFIAAVERASGRHVSTLVFNKTMLRLLGIASPLLREIAEMYYLTTDPVLLDDARLHAVLPQLHKTPYAIGIPATLDALRRTAAVARA